MNLKSESASKQVELQSKIDNATDGITNILSRLVSSSSSELDTESQQAVRDLITTVCPTSPPSLPSTSSSLNLSSDDVKMICTQVTELFNDLASFKAELNSLDEEVRSFMSQTKKDMEDMKKSFEKDMALMQADFQKEIKQIRTKSEGNDQYPRKNNLLLDNFRLPYWARRKDCDGFALACYVAHWLNKFLPMLSTPITPHNIDITHPLMNNSKGQTRLIIRFLNRHVRHNVFANREALLQHGISVSEHLTQENLALQRKAEAIVGESNVWSHDCKLFAFSQGKTISVWNEKSLSFLKPSFSSRINVLNRHNPT